VPFLHQLQSVPTQLAVDHGPSCGKVLGHSQEWSDSRPGHGAQSCPQALALPIVWSQLVNGAHSRVYNQSGCPKCSEKIRWVDKQPSLTQSQHPAMLEFDFERNRKAGLDPDKITAGSDKMVHWICTNCPKGQPYLFVARPNHRIGGNGVCPYCTSRKACICNSLQSLYPALAAEYDIVSNGIGPEQILPTSMHMAFWKDSSGHTWE